MFRLINCVDILAILVCTVMIWLKKGDLSSLFYIGVTTLMHLGMISLIGDVTFPDVPKHGEYGIMPTCMLVMDIIIAFKLINLDRPRFLYYACLFIQYIFLNALFDLEKASQKMQYNEIQSPNYQYNRFILHAMQAPMGWKFMFCTMKTNFFDVIHALFLLSKYAIYFDFAYDLKRE